jgi:hypothetical protein
MVRRRQLNSVPIPVIELRSPRRAVTAVCQRSDTRRCDHKLSWPTARAAVTSARSVPDRQTDRRHPDVAQVAERCCERNQLLLGSATTAGGLFNGALILHFLQNGCGCKVCTDERESVNCAVRAVSLGAIRVILYFPLQTQSFPFLPAKLFPTFLVRHCAIFIHVFSQAFCH